MYTFLVIFSLFYLLLLIYVFYGVYAMISGAPFVPSKRVRVDKMMELANLQPDDRAIDLGSGDGRITLAAAQYCKQSDGVEINPGLFWVSRLKQKARRVDNVNFTRDSLWDVDLSPYSVIFIYFIPHKMKKLAQKIKQEMLPGSRIVSNGFSFPDWPALKKDANIYLYEVSKQ